ncbi:copper chaperone [Saccharophagus sp. K07]|jgi:copper chaperone|uniref:heavy-metal-associated domain-containing protein n=1 Tax=Saccharophagus sp. K07 TaxID=2283636 RepID=UPI001651E63C|nr:heavy-metal-associated domain-containing protein [Saccharophagus sp. K07]MBC6905033.1 copper chaperone [Saccharophagus sp. K07]
MITFNVPDMTCGHCEKVITKAVKETDGNAKIHFDMKAKTVAIDSSSPSRLLQQAIEATGYEVTVEGSNDKNNSSCCGHCSI